MTALGHVLAARPGPRPSPVVELVDATAIGAQAGFQCRMVVFPALASRSCRETVKSVAGRWFAVKR